MTDFPGLVFFTSCISYLLYFSHKDRLTGKNVLSSVYSNSLYFKETLTMKRFLSTISVAASLVVFQSVTYAQIPIAQIPIAQSAADLLVPSAQPSSLERLPESDPEQIAAQPPLEVRISDEDFLAPAIEGDWRVDLLPDLARESGCASSSSGIVVVCFSSRH